MEHTVRLRLLHVYLAMQLITDSSEATRPSQTVAPNSINIHSPNAAIRALCIAVIQHFVELLSRPRSDKEMQHKEQTKNCKVFVLQDTSHLCLDNCETSNLGSANNHSLMWHISDQHCCEIRVIKTPRSPISCKYTHLFSHKQQAAAGSPSQSPFVMDSSGVATCSA
jgi:hypothetical protein